MALKVKGGNNSLLNFQRNSKLDIFLWQWEMMCLVLFELKFFLHPIQWRSRVHCFLRVGFIPCVVVSSCKELFQEIDAIFSSRPLGLAATVYTGSTNYKNMAGAPYGTDPGGHMDKDCVPDFVDELLGARYKMGIPCQPVTSSWCCW